jgi:hypothetical protein
MSRARSVGKELPAHDLPAAEEDRLPGRTVWLSGVVAAIVAVAAMFASNAILRAESAEEAAHPPSPTRAPDQMGIVEQTLILDTQRGLVERAAQRESLDHFGWSDRAHGIAKIPIDRAMDLVADPAFMRRAAVAPSADAGREGGR